MIHVEGSKAMDVRDVLRRSPVGHIPRAEETLNECLAKSIEVRCGMVDDRVACVWGLIPPTILSERAYLWLLTTDIVAEHKFLFVRYSQRYVEAMLQRYTELFGEVAEANHSAKRWLRWLGATFTTPIGGISSFTIKRKVLNGPH